MFLDLVYRHRQGAINIHEHMEAVHTFGIRLVLNQFAPPRHEDHKGIHPRGSPELNLWYSARGGDLTPPLRDLITEGMRLEMVIFSVIVCILLE